MTKMENISPIATLLENISILGVLFIIHLYNIKIYLIIYYIRKNSFRWKEILGQIQPKPKPEQNKLLQ